MIRDRSYNFYYSTYASERIVKMRQAEQEESAAVINSRHVKGILKLEDHKDKYVLTRHPPRAELSALVKHYWIVRWDLQGGGPVRQVVLSHPNVNMVFENGEAAIFGVSRATSEHILKDRGAVIGIKFMPGGFYPFWRESVSALTGKAMPAEIIFSADETKSTAVTVDRLLHAEDDAAAVKLVQALLMNRMPEEPDEMGERINRIVELIRTERDLLKVEEVAQRSGLSVRSLQRLFNRYIGVSPKWVIKRYRLHEAADQIEAGRRTDWTNLALDLGYYDQAHFIRDFKSIVGKSPESYAAP